MRSSDPLATAADMLDGAGIEAADRIFHGRNSAVWRLRAAGRDYALKHYFAQDGAARLRTEALALRFLEGQGVVGTVRLIACRPDHRLGLFGWVDGERVEAPSEDDLDAALGMIRTLRRLSSLPAAAALPPAREACFSEAEIVRQIDARIARLRAVAEEDAMLRTALRTRILPLREAVGGAGDDRELDRLHRVLSPSDFGFHNALRRPDGSLVFLDFEYFGWDDPVKLTADFLLHPGMRLADTQRARFRVAAETLFADDPGFSGRLRRCLPLYVLRWSLILMNEFLPERWHERHQAGVASDHEAAKAAQIEKLGRLLASSGGYLRGVASHA